MEILGTELPVWELEREVRLYGRTTASHRLSAERRLRNRPDDEMDSGYVMISTLSLVDGPRVLQVKIPDCLVAQIEKNGMRDTADVMGIVDAGFYQQYQYVSAYTTNSHLNQDGDECVDLVVTLEWPNWEDREV